MLEGPDDAKSHEPTMHKPSDSDDLPFLDEPEETTQSPPSGSPPDAADTPPAGLDRSAQPAQSSPPAQPNPPAKPTPPAQQPITPTPEAKVAAEEEPEYEPAAPTPVRRSKSAVIPPAVLAARMQRYSIYLIVLAFIIVGANYQALTLSSILWFAAGVTAAFALLCAIAVVLLNAIAWNFDRLARELRGDQKAVDLSGH